MVDTGREDQLGGLSVGLSSGQIERQAADTNNRATRAYLCFCAQSYGLSLVIGRKYPTASPVSQSARSISVAVVGR